MILIGIGHALLGLLFVGFGVYCLVAGGAAMATLGKMRQTVSTAGSLLPGGPGGEVSQQFNAAADAGMSSFGGTVMTMVLIVVGCSFLQGLPLLFGGLGVIRRRPGSRGLAVAMATLLGVEGVVCLLIAGPNMPMRATGIGLIVYAMLAYLILLGRGAALQIAPAGVAADPNTPPAPAPSRPAESPAAGPAPDRPAAAPVTQDVAAPPAAPRPPATDPYFQEQGGASSGVIVASMLMSAATSALVAFAMMRYLPPEQRGAEKVRGRPAGTVRGAALQQEGQFTFDRGHKGEVVFPQPFAVPPTAEIERGEHADNLIVTEVTEWGFKWRDRWEPERTSSYSPAAAPRARWTARGFKSGSP
jgi:hypothetical protein